jgi:NHL repeat
MTKSGRSVCGGSFVIVIALTLFGPVLPAPAAEAPPLLRQFCEGTQSGSASGAAGRCVAPRGIAVDSVSGDVYVADSGNDRIQKFTAWGRLLRVWGWDVVASGPGDDTTGLEDEFEICIPANGDVCKAGTKGGGRGQLVRPQGLAVDSAGAVYVTEGDFVNRRVQKFDTEGNFLLMFGGEVNKTKVEAAVSEAEQNLCPIDPGDMCQAASEGTGSGQFGPWVLGSYIAIDANQTPTDGDDTLYVGDKQRVQEFDTEGSYVGDLPDPEGLLIGETVRSLAIDPAGDLYLGFSSENPLASLAKDDVLKLAPTGEEVCTMKVARVIAIAANVAGQVQVVSAELKITGGAPIEIVQFDPACVEISRFDAEVVGFTESTGLATSSACGIKGTDLFISNADTGDSFIRIYGPPPNPDICPPPQLAPSIDDTYAISVDTDGATVAARINPHFWPDTTYYVQYGTGKCSEGGCGQTALFPGAKLGGGVFDEARPSTGVFLGGLAPDTTYHYRFLAESSGGGPTTSEEAIFHTFPTAPESNTNCPNQAFRTGPSAALPDCRAYELVSPLDKNNGDIATGEASLDQASEDGQRLVFSSYTAFGEPVGAPISSQYLAERNPGAGWSTRSISPPSSTIALYPTGGFNSQQFKAFSEDLCSGWLLEGFDVTLTPDAPPGVPSLYRRSLCEEEGYELLTTVAPPGFSFKYLTSGYLPTIRGFSADHSRSVFVADAALTPDATPTPGLYQAYEVYEGGKLRLVSVLPNGNAATTQVAVGVTQDEGENDFRSNNLHHAVSEDASRVFWIDTGDKDLASISEPDVKGLDGGKLYLRDNAAEEQSTVTGGKCTEAAKACSYRVSQLISPEPAYFWLASSDGSRAIFSLAPDNNDPESENLYEFNAKDEGGLKTEATLIAKGFEGVMGASRDASRLYLVSREVLTGPEENSEGDQAAAGEPNLYLYELGIGFSYVATLSSLDIQNQAISSAPPSPIATYADHRSARVTADGLQAAFTSAAPLTGYDNTEVKSGEPATEVYYYDAAARDGEGELLCASCNPSEARPVGRNFGGEGGAGGAKPFWIASRIPGWETALHPSRALSNDGSRLFFESFDALVLADTNGRQDVYEWEMPGAGDCTQEAATFSAPNGGCLTLISSGQSATDSEFFDASSSGSDVFFATHSSLLPQDFGLVDVYDARANGGFPPPPVAPPGCEGEACQGTPSPPSDPTPASSTFQGAGNVQEPRLARCRKGKVRRKGRCAARKKQRKQAGANRRVQR